MASIKIFDNKRCFFQWDTGQRVIVLGMPDCNEVHFEDATASSEGAYVSKTFRDEQGYICALVPDELLQDYGEDRIWAYAHSDRYDGDKDSTTMVRAIFAIEKRQKPRNYVYTPTEKQHWEDIVDIKGIEQTKVGVGSDAENEWTLTLGDQRNDPATYTKHVFIVKNGEKGEKFSIDVSYDTESAMRTDTSQNKGTVAVIAGSTEMEQAGKMYIWDGSEWKYLADLSGKQGIQGPAGEITDVTATIDSNTGTPNVNVTLGGTPSKREIGLDFHGMKGERGDTGLPAGIATPTVDNSSAGLVGSPSVEVSASGPDTAKVFNFKFSNMKGNKGDKGEKGDTGEVSKAQLDATLLGYQKKLPLYLSEEGYICYGE